MQLVSVLEPEQNPPPPEGAVFPVNVPLINEPESEYTPPPHRAELPIIAQFAAVKLEDPQYMPPPLETYQEQEASAVFPTIRQLNSDGLPRKQIRPPPEAEEAQESLAAAVFPLIRQSVSVRSEL